MRNVKTAGRQPLTLRIRVRSELHFHRDATPSEIAFLLREIDRQVARAAKYIDLECDRVVGGRRVVGGGCATGKHGRRDQG